MVSALLLLYEAQATVAVARGVGSCGRHENHLLEVRKEGKELIHQRVEAVVTDVVIKNCRVDGYPRDILHVDVAKNGQGRGAECVVDVDQVVESADPKAATRLAIVGDGSENEDVVLPGPVADISNEASGCRLSGRHVAMKGDVVKSSADVPLALEVVDTGRVKQQQLQENHPNELHGELGSRVHREEAFGSREDLLMRLSAELRS